jgi:hypothetical protein
MSRTVYKTGTIALLATVLLGVSLLISSPSYAATRTSTSSTVAKQNLSQLVGKDSNVQVETLTLPAASCSALQKAHPGASCQVFSYSTLTIHPILPQGRLAAAGETAWYAWSSSSWVCSVVGCWYWGLHLQANGVLNHVTIWQWNVFCNARGLASCTWHGFFGNGTRTIQIGLDGNACIAYCASHGIRKSINANGAQVSYYTW